MRNVGIVQGSTAQAVPLVIGTDTVYVHTDIRELPDGLWEYREIQYDKDEYILLVAEKSYGSEDAVVEIAALISDTVDAMAELAAIVGGDK